MVLLLLVGCGVFSVKDTEDDPRRRRPGGQDEGGQDDGGQDGGAAPTVGAVSITPRVPYVDGSVRCDAETTGTDLDVTWAWENETTGRTLGTGREIVLSPDEISPGDTLRCAVSAEDGRGRRASASGEAVPGCGYADPGSLGSIDAEISITFRPWITDDLEPGYGGQPWDWDGQVPDWWMDVAGALEEVLGLAATIYPDPNLVSAAEAAEYANELLALIDEYAPGFMEPYVPPDPDVFPYVADSDGNLWPFFDGDVGIQWEDSYEIGVAFEDVDLTGDVALVLDLEDVDVAFDDDMGDWLDQGSYPLVLGADVFLDGAYCTSVYYNPSDDPQGTDDTYVPSSILLMRIDNW